MINNFQTFKNATPHNLTRFSTEDELKSYLEKYEGTGQYIDVLDFEFIDQDIEVLILETTTGKYALFMGDGLTLSPGFTPDPSGGVITIPHTYVFYGFQPKDITDNRWVVSMADEQRDEKSASEPLELYTLAFVKPKLDVKEKVSDTVYLEVGKHKGDWVDLLVSLKSYKRLSK